MRENLTLWGKVAITRVKIWDIVTLWDIKLQLPETKSHYDIWSHNYEKQVCNVE